MSDLDRIPTHIEGLDEKMQGGIPQGHICIVAGASGAMKSSLTFSMLYNAVLYGETSGIYVTLEQGKDSLRSHMANMGMNVDDPAYAIELQSSISLICEFNSTSKA